MKENRSAGVFYGVFICQEGEKSSPLVVYNLSQPRNILCAIRLVDFAMMYPKIPLGRIIFYCNLL